MSQFVDTLKKLIDFYPTPWLYDITTIRDANLDHFIEAEYEYNEDGEVIGYWLVLPDDLIKLMNQASEFLEEYLVIKGNNSYLRELTDKLQKKEYAWQELEDQVKSLEQSKANLRGDLDEAEYLLDKKEEEIDRLKENIDSSNEEIVRLNKIINKLIGVDNG